MTQYFTDFSAYATGAAPGDWTPFYATDGVWEVRAAAGATGGKVLHGEDISTSGLRGLMWDVVAADAARDNVELVARYQLTNATTYAQFSLLVRGTGTFHTTDASYYAGMQTASERRVVKRITASLTTIQSAAFSPALNQWLWMRVRVNGTSLQVKHWADGDVEPVDWTFTRTETQLSAAGFAGIALGAGSALPKTVVNVDIFGVGTGGDSAPTSAPASTPVAFSGSVSNQTGTEGAVFSLNLSTYFSGSETPFAYSVQAGTLPAGLSLNGSTGVISGTPTTAGVSSGIVIRATDATPDTADTNAFSITINAAGDADPPTLTGSVTFASITQTSYTAQWPAGSDNVAVTGYEYQIGGTAGAWTDAGNNLSAAITGRTPGATETVYVRAYDAAGLRSTPTISGSVTLLSATTDGTITVGSALYPIKYSSASVLNESGLRATVLDATTLAQVLNTSGVVCTNGVITITDAALVIGGTYHLAVKTASGWTGFSDAVTAS